MSGRRVRAMVSVAALVLGAAVIPAASMPIPTGFAKVTVDAGCLARVVKGPYKKIVSGRTELPTGRYSIVVRPKGCRPVPRTIRIREHKTVRAHVYNAPRDLPVTLRGTVRGTETTAGVQTASWEATVVLQLVTPAVTTASPGFATAATYRVTGLEGSYTIDHPQDGCTLRGAGALGMQSVAGATAWSNPWGGGRYTVRLPGTATWSYERVCPDGTTVEQRPAPELLLTTNAWDAATPVAPPQGATTGTFVLEGADLRYDYSWSLVGSGQRRVSRPV